MERIDMLALISEDPDRVTRTFCSPAMRKANDLVASWMKEAGMSVLEDAIGNVIGRYPGQDEQAKTFILGSHLDTVRDAGKFDGPLGVVAAIACVEQLHEQNIRLPFAIEVVSFADEEGVRFQTTYLGSRVLAGTFDMQHLKRVDSHGVTMAEAIRKFGGNPDKLKDARRDPQQLLGYAEIHIEQGPVLEKNQQPVGVVSAIAGQTRIKVRFTGQAGHAGTTPMALRKDALAAAAQFIVSVEMATQLFAGLLATVGQIEVQPGASNVIPGEVVLTVDVRHKLDGSRSAACARLQEVASQAGEKRGVAVEWEVVHEAQSVPCSRELSNLLAKAARKHLMEVSELISGAGHDAAAMGDITPAAMLFVRCKGGISHHPDESVTMEDVGMAIAVMSDFLQLLTNERKAGSVKQHA
ncbi:MAG: allantoate amidohydrolase [Pedosphaera sp.]|nr:allantoate amidohydrolase [Pedosphaera sp.]